MYAIIDVETTGGSPVSERITEIAVYIYNGIELTDEFSTLLNPEKKIPYYISALTGISNAMVADAPRFYEVARKIVEMTENCTFVAHNASFDYQFIRHEFKRLGYDYTRDRLCTVQLSRKLLPGLRSYSLGNICRHLNIVIHDRHRAGGDAYATFKLFEYLAEIGREKGIPVNSSGIDRKMLHPNLDPETINLLPEDAGTYYFYNEVHELVYIGKSKNIRNRVLSHFRNYTSRKSIEMMNSVAEIDYELTGSELIALLKESHEIKLNMPLYNRAQRRAVSNYGIYSYYDKDQYLRFVIERNKVRQEVPLRTFASLSSAKAYMNNMAEENELCLKLCGLYPSSGACFHYEIAQCRGACCGKEGPESYNKRAEILIRDNELAHQNFFLIDKGRNDEEYAIIHVNAGRYMGYGYISSSCMNGDLSLLGECVSRFEDNREVQQIIRTYLRTGNPVRVMAY